MQSISSKTETEGAMANRAVLQAEAAVQWSFYKEQSRGSVVELLVES
jgi:hypothetical protein